MLRWSRANLGIWTGLLALLLLVCRWSGAAAGEPFIRDWWLTETNMPIRVNDVLEDANGYLWLATEQGLFRFNGTSFYQLPESRGQEATTLALQSHALLAGFRSGKAARIIGEKLLPLTYRGRQADAAITHFAQIGALRAFGTLGSGLWYMLRDSAHVLNAVHLLRDDYVYALQPLPSGAGLLLATDRGVDFVNAVAGKIQAVPLVKEGIMRVLKPIPGRPACYIAGSQEGAWYVIRMDKSQDTPVITAHQLPAAIADVAFIGARLLIFTEDGMARCYEPQGASAAYRETDRFETGARVIRKAFVDRNENLWLATATGLSQCSYSYLRHVTLPQPFSLAAITALAYGDNRIWYAQGNQLRAYNLQTRQVDIQTRLPASVTTMAADSQGLWIGTLGSGLLFRTYGKTAVVHTFPGTETLAQEHILDVTTQANRLWVATLNGVGELAVSPEKAASIRRHTHKNGLSADYVYQIMADARGDVWMATDGGGVCRYDGRHYHATDSGQQGRADATVYSLAQDKYHNVWAATLERGLSVFNGKQWRDIGMQQGLQSIRTEAVAALGNGNVVVAHDRGADIWLAQTQQFRHINRRLGVGIDSGAARLNCLATDEAGNVWMPFGKGLLQIMGASPARLSTPGLVLQGISLYGSPPAPDAHAFAPGENSPAFHYEGINLLNPEKLQYRYRLEGLAREWTYTRDEAVPFHRLRPGAYRFVVEASYSPSFTNVARREYPFTIAAPFWTRLWFIALALGAVAALIVGAVRIREQNIRRLAALQRARVEAEYQHLKTQVNPHFLFNSLNILTTLIRRDGERAIEYTLALSDLYRHVLQHSPNDRIPLAEEWEILRQYLLIQQTRFGDALRLQTDVPGAALTRFFIVPLTLQMLVENSIKHNVVSAAQPLTIHIRLAGKTLLVRNTYQPRPQPEQGTGLGLANIQRRYAMLGQVVSYGIDGDSFVVTFPLL